MSTVTKLSSKITPVYLNSSLPDGVKIMTKSSEELSVSEPYSYETKIMIKPEKINLNESLKKYYPYVLGLIILLWVIK